MERVQQNINLILLLPIKRLINVKLVSGHIEDIINRGFSFNIIDLSGNIILLNINL